MRNKSTKASGTSIPYNVFQSLARAYEHLLIGGGDRFEDAAEQSFVRDPDGRIIKRYFYPCPPSIESLKDVTVFGMGKILQLLELWRLYGKYLGCLHSKTDVLTDADLNKQEITQLEQKQLCNLLDYRAREIFQSPPWLVKKTLLSSDVAIEAAASWSLKETKWGDNIWRWCDPPPALTDCSPLSMKDRCKLWRLYNEYVENCFAVMRMRQREHYLDFQISRMLRNARQQIEEAERSKSTCFGRISNVFFAVAHRLPSGCRR